MNFHEHTDCSVPMKCARVRAHTHTCARMQTGTGQRVSISLSLSLPSPQFSVRTFLMQLRCFCSLYPCASGIAHPVHEPSRPINMIKRKRTPSHPTTPSTTEATSRRRPASSEPPPVMAVDSKASYGPSWCDADDEDRLFCLSLVYHLKKLPPQRRSLTRMSLQRILHDAQFGSCMEPQYSMQAAANIQPVPFAHTWPSYYSPGNTAAANPVHPTPGMPRPDLARSGGCMPVTSQPNLVGGNGGVNRST